MGAATQAHDLGSGVLTPLVGRERALDAAAGLVLREDVRLVTLVGPPGIGKTRLALAVAARLRAPTAAAAGGARPFADGVCLVPLAAVRDPALVVPAIAQALGISEERDPAPREGLRRYLREKRLLLVLDNLEQVLPAAPEIVELLAAAPSVTVLATSRAAASSRARGSPSRRRQMCATAAAFSGESAKPGWAARARATNSRTAS